MHRTATRFGVAVPRLEQAELWLLVVLFYGVGDLLTTGLGLATPGVAEGNRITAILIEQYGLASLAVLKAIIVAACYAVWIAIPSPHNVGVPAGLAALGVGLTVWNLHVIAFALVL